MNAQQPQVPEHWEVDSSQVEFLGHDDSSRQYWRINQDVYRHSAGFTIWISKLNPYLATGRKRYNVL